MPIKNLYQKIGFLRNSSFMRKYAKDLEELNLKVDPLVWIILSLIVAFLLSMLTYFILLLVNGLFAWIMVLIIGFVTADLLIGYPYLKGISRIKEIENDLPDALKQMADILKAGGTYEYALREIASSDFGPLTKEIRTVLRKLEEGENFENSLLSLSKNIDSRLVQRSVTIIIDSVRAGAGLADILEEIAEDIRQTNRIEHERKGQTLMQVLFMIAAGTIVTPFIFGLVTTVSNFMISTTAQFTTEGVAIARKAIENKNLLITLMQLYIFVEVSATSVMLSLMREGKKNKSIIYVPVLLFIAYIVYFVASIVTDSLLLGGLK
jgi:pilus assembly protein TadC